MPADLRPPPSSRSGLRQARRRRAARLSPRRCDVGAPKRNLAPATAELPAATSRAGTTSDVTQVSNGNGSILGGNEINAPINAPINVCGNSVAVLGSALSGCRGGATVTSVACRTWPC